MDKKSQKGNIMHTLRTILEFLSTSLWVEQTNRKQINKLLSSHEIIYSTLHLCNVF